MALVSEIILDAFRETNILPLGASPNASQTAEALRLLNNLISTLYGTDAGELLEDWPLGNYGIDYGAYVFRDLDDWFIRTPHLNRRILATNNAPHTVYFSQRPQDGSRMAIVDPYNRLSQVPVTIDGNGRPVEGQPTLLLDVDGTHRTWFYRADKGQWMKLDQLVETDQLPFPDEFNTFFTTMLALRINPRYGRDMDQQSQYALDRSRRAFVNRYLQSLPMRQNPILSWPFMSDQSYSQYQGYASNFNTGNPI